MLVMFLVFLIAVFFQFYLIKYDNLMPKDHFELFFSIFKHFKCIYFAVYILNFCICCLFHVYICSFWVCLFLKTLAHTGLFPCVFWDFVLFMITVSTFKLCGNYLKLEFKYIPSKRIKTVSTKGLD